MAPETRKFWLAPPLGSHVHPKPNAVHSMEAQLLCLIMGVTVTT